MVFRILTCILALALFMEGGYIFWHRHPINRFRTVEDNGYVAFDSATGQLCRTYRTKPSPKRAPAVLPSDRFAEKPTGDPILDAMRNGPTSVQAGEDTEVEFVRGLPACADIR
jgi:hypothetical protein